MKSNIFIYVLFGIIWLIYLIYKVNLSKKKANKSKPVTQINEENTKVDEIKPKSIIEEFFPELSPLTDLDSDFDDKKINIKHNTYKYDNKNNIGAIQSNETKIEGVSLEEEIFDKKNQSNKKENMIDKTIHDDIPEIDIRTAIVYSEILKRPKY